VILETMRLCGGIWPPHLRIDRRQKVILETLHRHGIVTRVPHSAVGVDENGAAVDIRVHLRQVDRRADRC
jgi:hypothetical protein